MYNFTMSLNVEKFHGYVDLYHEPNKKKWTLSIIILMLPFYLNDFLYIPLKDSPEILYPLDHGLRAFVLILCFLLFGKAGLRLHSSLAPKEKKDLLIDTLIVPILFTAIYLFFNLIVQETVPNYFNFGFRWPRIENQVFRWLDLTLGLLFVSLTEELVFRRHVYAYFGYFFHSDIFANVMQAIFFGFIHWSSGFQNVFSAIIFGIMAGIFYDRKKYLLPVIIFHTLTNFMLFPKPWN